MSRLAKVPVGGDAIPEVVFLVAEDTNHLFNITFV